MRTQTKKMVKTGASGLSTETRKEIKKDLDKLFKSLATPWDLNTEEGQKIRERMQDCFIGCIDEFSLREVLE